MRLLSFTCDGDAGIHVGVLADPERVIDLPGRARHAGGPLPFDPTDMHSLIAAGPVGMTAIRDLLQGSGAPLALDQLRLLPPIPRVRKNVFCVGWNYLDHYAEAQALRPGVQTLPAHPHFFSLRGDMIGRHWSWTGEHQEPGGQDTLFDHARNTLISGDVLLPARLDRCHLPQIC